jgi:lysophospholipase L1-like esterase
MNKWILGGIAMTLMFAPDGVSQSASAQNQPFPLVPAAQMRLRGGIGNVLAKLKAGQDVKIAYFGGSITAAPGWRPKTLKWFQQQYPQSKISEINAAIGGTGSDLGVYRNQQDVLQHKPDLVFVEFAVNDGGASPENIWRGMEGIVRQTWKANPNTDIAFVYTFQGGQAGDLKNGNFPRSASAMEKLADYYNIPSISVAYKMSELLQAGKLWIVPEKDENGKDKPTPEGILLFSTDSTHPLDAAHQVYADVVAEAIKAMEPIAPVGAHELKAPMQADNWENAKIVPVQQSMLTPGWKKLDATSPFKGFFNRMPEMWEATTPGEKISFRFKGTAAKLYDLLGPDGAKVKVTLDGKTWTAQRFDSYCSYHRLATLGIGDGLPDTEHTVSVEILPEQPDRSIVTDKEKLKPGFDPKKYDGTAMRVGGVMIIGELLP